MPMMKALLRMEKPMATDAPLPCEGIMLVDKPKGRTAFDLVAILRKRLNVRTIGHAGTLDPMATGVMVMLIGRKYTALSNSFLGQDKEYVGQICLGMETDTYDAEGVSVATSALQPSEAEVAVALAAFQGEISQLPPMYSAKKVNGQKLYQLARQGKTVERTPALVQVNSELLSYQYPHLEVRITCSKGTYVRSIAHDVGKLLGCGAHLSALQRTRSGNCHLAECLSGDLLYSGEITSLQLMEWLRRDVRL
jgi:tRNA pseudouridine55 synthase